MTAAVLRLMAVGGAFALTAGALGCAGPVALPPPTAPALSGAERSAVPLGGARALAVGPNGRLTVASDDGVQRVELTPGGFALGPVVSALELRNITALADPAGRDLFAATGDGRVVRISEGGLVATAVAPRRDAERAGPFVAVAVGPDGVVFTATDGVPGVQRWRDGVQIADVAADGPDAVLSPSGLALGDGLWVADAARGRFVQLGPLGRFKTSRDAPGIRWVGAADGHLLTIQGGTVVVRTADGERVLTVAVDTAEPLLAVAAVDGELLVLTPSWLASVGRLPPRTE